MNYDFVRSAQRVRRRTFFMLPRDTSRLALLKFMRFRWHISALSGGERVVFDCIPVKEAMNLLGVVGTCRIDGCETIIS